ncbi:MAG TPA: hypothetical protein VGM87_19305 [Roseomonas sp.]|jgi:hypothetical protein
MPVPISFLEFAGIAKAAYHPEVTTAGGGFTRHSPMDRRVSGFQGAIYRRPAGDWVVGIAGTQPGQDSNADIVADAGFGGSRTGIIGGILGGPILGPLISLGSAMGAATLEAQCAAASDLVGQARGAMPRGDRLYLTGHSLGGGICQIIAARLGVPAVCFNPPSVTAVSGVKAAYDRTRPAIVCLQVRNDPINHTKHVGAWLGKVVPLPTARTGGGAHSIDQTYVELSPSGPFTAIGARDPFSF